MAKSKHRKKHKKNKKHRNKQKSEMKASRNHRRKAMNELFKRFSQQKLVQKDITVNDLIHKIQDESSEEE